MLESQHKESKEQSKFIKAIFLVSLGTIIYSIGVVWILQIGGFISGGVTGTSQLIVGLIKNFSNNDVLASKIEDFLGIMIGIINVPLLIFGWKGVSKHFSVLTVISIVLQTTTISLLTHFTVSPFIFFLDYLNGGTSTIIIENGGILDLFNNASFSIFKTADTQALQEVFKQDMVPGVRILFAIMGGLITGFGAGLCLKAGGSTGGMDIISNYLVMKKRTPFTKLQFSYDITIILLSGLISIESVLYTIVRLLVYVKVLQAIYQTYQTVRIEIITDHADEIKCELLKKFYHSMTIYDAIGGYTNQNRKVIEIYAMNFETNSYISIINSIDPKAFVVITKVKMIRGNYVQRTVL